MSSSTRVLPLLAALLLATPLYGQGTGRGAVVWHDRGDPALLDLSSGPGGRRGEPGTRFRFLAESTSGTSPKFEIEDEHGVAWKAKLGEEGPGETAASRLLWAVGFSVDEDYYRTEIRVSGLPRALRKRMPFPSPFSSRGRSSRR